VKLIVDDGSGPRRVTLFDTVRERIPAGDRLTSGAQVRVIGKVNVYRKVAEIAVALPYDVTVLESKK
jgi:DNA/RNA endonuclease YhcR with UshA esterase domain